MLRLFSTIRKELLILFRDKGGLAIMFLMPIAMIIIMSLIQDGPFRDYQELKIPLLLVDNDSGTFGKAIEEGLKKSKIFEINKRKITTDELKQKIAEADYQVGIIIPAEASIRFNKRLDKFVTETLSKAGIAESGQTKDSSIVTNDSTIEVASYFAPDIKESFKASILSSLKQFSSQLETQTLLASFSKKLNIKDTSTSKQGGLEKNVFVEFKEFDPDENKHDGIHLNSVQHNVPAWTIFGMFFIVVSMAGSIIKEREDGSYLRLRTMPGSYLVVLAGKITAYLFICLIQCLLMLMVGIYLMPLLGLPQLVIGGNVITITLTAICCGLAATGYGVMIGALFSTYQQASTFGAVSIVILAALGGIWVPVQVMPDSIRMFAEFSPLYWGLNAFHDIFIRNASAEMILPYLSKLLLFFIVTIGIAYLFNKVKVN